jgi:diguanylate cyclase (GGDEF)-like protein
MYRAKPGTTPDELELRGFNRSLAEIEWLLLILVLVYLVVPHATVANIPALILACAGFALFVLGFRYVNLFRLEARWKLTVETWAMILFTAFAVWHTGKIDSPLISLYLLVIVFSALTLGKVITLLEVALIASFYLHAAYYTLGSAMFSYELFSRLMLNFAPFVLVAYLTSLLAADINLARASARELSETDELTGLPNMRAFSALLERQVADADGKEGRFAVMMVDADRLKPINDEMGHDAGNEMILHVVRGIRRGLRATDVVARYGGDEFVVLLPDADEDAAREVAERVRLSVSNSALDIGGRSVSTTVSIGFAVYPDTATAPRELLARADDALYRSKDGGRDRACSYHDPMEPESAASDEPAAADEA